MGARSQARVHARIHERPVWAQRPRCPDHGRRQRVGALPKQKDRNTGDPTSIKKSPVLSPACHATPPSSTDSRYCRAGNAGVGVNSSMGVSAGEATTLFTRWETFPRRQPGPPRTPDHRTRGRPVRGMWAAQAPSPRACRSESRVHADTSRDAHRVPGPSHTSRPPRCTHGRACPAVRACVCAPVIFFKSVGD